MDRVLDGVNGDIVKVESNAEIERACPTNFNLRSECFAAVVFDEVDPASQALVSISEWVDIVLMIELHLEGRFRPGKGRCG